MPLLGRHKSLPGSGANQSSGKGGASAGVAPATGSAARQQQQQPLVCESPLFGVRRQLPVATQAAPSESERRSQRGASSAASSISSSTSLSSRLGSGGSSSATAAAAATTSGRQQLQHQLSNDGLLGSTLSSIPAQISRQQIHYAFSIMDTNSDGLIDLRDLSQMLANLGVPIDEAILSHVLAPVSKRGDHLISESEFLDWIGNFIQVNEDEGAASSSGRGTQQQTASSRRTTGGRGCGEETTRSPVSRSASASQSPVSLAAQSPEAQFVINQQLRQRRGSGSGLALVRSLSSSSAGSPSGNDDSAASVVADQAGDNKSSKSGSSSSSDAASAANSRRERQLLDKQEARRDLKAAFCVFDLDGDGFITIDEVQKGLKLLDENWSQAELSQLFSQCNSNKGGAQATTTTSARQQRTDLSKQRISIDDFVQLLE